MNEIQYISTTHTSKESAKENKKKCNSFHNIYYKEADFDEICYIHDNGSTFGRIGKETDFIVIDIDHTSVNISSVAEFYKTNKNYHVGYSSSMNPLKYHILVYLGKTITINEYENAVIEEFSKIKENLCGRCDYMELDKNASNFYQCFFGESVAHSSEFILENSKRLYSWTKKDEDPKFYTDKEIKIHPSLNSADYCKKNGLLTVKENKRFDIYLPSMTNGRMKPISEGHRWNWCRMTGTKLLMRIFHLNHQFNENWTKWDFLDTVEWIFKTNIVKPNEFETDMKQLLLWLDNKWDILVTKTYEEQCTMLEPYFDCSKKQYKSRAYNASVMNQMIFEHQIDENTVLFTDKKELQEICQENLIDYYKFIKFANSVHFTVAFECVTKRKNKGNCLEGYKIEGNKVFIPKDSVTSAIRKYCSKNKIEIVRL